MQGGGRGGVGEREETKKGKDERGRSQRRGWRAGRTERKRRNEEE